MTSAGDETAPAPEEMTMEFRYRFAPFGTSFIRQQGLRPHQGRVNEQDLYEDEIAVDVGGACWDSTGANAGVLDHHFLLAGTNRQPFPSAAAAVLHQASLVAGSYKDRFETAWLVTHQQPDFDAACAMFLARSVIEGKIPATAWPDFGLKPDRWEPGPKAIDWFAPRIAEPPERRWPVLLAAYAAAIDNCRRIRCPRERSLHSILYAAHARRGGGYIQKDGALPFFQEVADALASSSMQLDPLNDSVLENSPAFVFERRLLDQEGRAYLRDLRRARRAVVFLQRSPNSFSNWFPRLQNTPLLNRDGSLDEAHLQRGSPRQATDGLYIRDPECLLFKEWARGDLESAPMGQGFLFTAVAYSQALTGAKRNSSRYIVSVDPERAQGRHVYDVWVRLQAKELSCGPTPGVPRPSFERRARGAVRPGQPAWPCNDAWHDPWFDGQNYNGTIIDTPNNGTVLGEPGTAADLSDDPIGRIVQRQLELAGFASDLIILDVPSYEEADEPPEVTLPVDRVLELARPPIAGCLRFGRVSLQPDVAVLNPWVARQIARTLWTILDPDQTEGRPEEALDGHMLVDAEAITVWSRRGVVIAEKPHGSQAPPRSSVYASHMQELARLSREIQALLRSSKGRRAPHDETPPGQAKSGEAHRTTGAHHPHDEDLRKGELLILDVAKLKHEFASPQARPLQRFLAASGLDEVLSMVRDVNTVRALDHHISSIAHVQRLIHSVEFFLVAVYAVEWFHALSDGFELHGPAIGWATFGVGVVSVVLALWLLQGKPAGGTRRLPPEEQRSRWLLAYMLALFLLVTVAMHFYSAHRTTARAGADLSHDSAAAAGPVASPPGAVGANFAPAARQEASQTGPAPEAQTPGEPQQQKAPSKPDRRPAAAPPASGPAAPKLHAPAQVKEPGAERS
jgi:hypothetical protein